MKWQGYVLLLQLLVLTSCAGSMPFDAIAPKWLATVHASLPGNIMAEDVPGNAVTPRYKRHIYVLLNADIYPQLDSVVYANNSIAFTIEKVEMNNGKFMAGKNFSSDEPLELSAVQGKSWWVVDPTEENELLNGSEKLLHPIKIYGHQNNVAFTWLIDHEITLAPQPRY